MSLPAQDENTIEQSLRDAGNPSLGDGHADPSGLFPDPAYYGSTNVAYEATGASRNELNMGGSVPGVDIDQDPPISSQYPYNQINQTASGHSIELDDTPGAERVLVRHNSGSGIEIRPDGSVVISSVGMTQRAQGAMNIVVDGPANLMYNSGVTQEIRGDYNLAVTGDFNVNVGGNRSSTITGSDRRRINGAVGDLINGGLSVTSTKQATMTYLEGLSVNAKGEMSQNVDGTANFVSSGSMAITSQTDLLIATESGIISSTSLNISAASGNWGGESVVIGAQGALFSEGVTAPTFHGDLDGTADVAATSEHQSYEDGTGAGYTPSRGTRGSITNTPTPSDITVPSSESQSTNLNSTGQGIRRVLIDVGNFIRNFINRTESYGGVSSIPVSAPVARSRLRDPANRANTTFTGQLLGEQVLCTSYTVPAPEGIGRIVQEGDRQPTDTGSQVVPGPNVISAYRPSFTEVTLVPEVRYNPNFNTPITSATELESNITVATFLGTSDPTTLNHIRDANQRVALARYWYLMAQFIKSVATNTDDFENYSLRVVEGLYRPGPDETVTAGSINDLKMQGRAVVFELVNSRGVSSPTKTFDLCVYWKDIMYYDTMILSYDTIECTLNSQIIITLPELTADWEGRYRRLATTEYNNTTLTQGELVECLPFPSSVGAVPEVNLNADGGDYGINLGASDLGQPLFTRSGAHPEVFASAPAQLASLLSNEYANMQSYYGGPLRINDALPHRRTSRTPPSRGGTSAHWSGRAIDISTRGMSNADKDRLVYAALRAGFTGFGFGVTILHVDIASSRHWKYSNTSFGSKLVGPVSGRNDTWAEVLAANRISR